MTTARETRATLVEWLRRLQHGYDHDHDVAFGSCKKSLTVHLLGGDHREGNSVPETFEVFWSFSQHVARETHLSSLHLVLVGPNLLNKLHLQNYSENGTAGKESSDGAVKVQVLYFVDDFEAYFEDKTLYWEPDIVVYFNAGIWGYDQWLPALRLLLDEVRVPLLATSYNENEAGDDEDVLEELTPSRWFWRPEKNAHGARTPRVTNNEDGAVLMENDYWMCLSGRPQ